MYSKVYVHDKESRYFMAMMRNYITNSDGEIIYAEFVGQEKDVRRILKEIRDRYGISVVIEGGENIERGFGKRKIVVEPLEKGCFGYVYDEDAIKGGKVRVLLGKEDQILDLFKKWLRESQPLPYARGFYEKIGMEAEEALFHKLNDLGHIKTLHSLHADVHAYEISTAILGAKEGMQAAILDIAKQCGLLEIDRVRQLLTDKAPKIGESNPKETPVWVTLRNQSADMTYYVIEYDVVNDSAFCLVKQGDEVLWEEHRIEDIFFNESIGMLKGDEYKNIAADIDGNIFKIAA